MKLTHTEVVNRLGKLFTVIEWVGSDVTASFKEKQQVHNDLEYILQQMNLSSDNHIDRNMMVTMNALWNYYTTNLTGSNVPLKIKRLVEVQ